MKILFLIPYPLNEAPSQRFRFEQYLEMLPHNGHAYETQSFFDSHSWKLFLKTGNNVAKMAALFTGFFRRVFMLFKIPRYDLIFIHREAAPLGPPVFEYIITRMLKKKVIYDFDDAIWLTDRPDESWVLRTLKNRSKVKKVIRWSFKVSCGNDYLCEYARNYNNNVVLNPTTIDTKNLHNPARYQTRLPSESIVIGWTGSHSTLKYLKDLEPVLQEIKRQYPKISFTVIADRDPLLDVPSTRFVGWSLASEITELARFDIGIMPLPDDEWSKGKCGFKALQYMALEIPTIASPVGVNTAIITHGVNGFVASSPKQWLDAFGELIRNTRLRQAIGKEARKTIEQHYSVDSNTRAFLALFAS